MKKLISLMLALALCLCTLHPAMAENPAVPSFSFTLTEYQEWFDAFAGMMGTTPVWTIAADGLSATAELDMTPVLATGVDTLDIDPSAQITSVLHITLNAEGKVLRVSTDARVSVSSINEGLFAFGVVYSITASAAVVTENPDRLYKDQTDLTLTEEALHTMNNRVFDRTVEAMKAPVSETVYICGHPATLTLSLSIESGDMIMDLEFSCEP